MENQIIRTFGRIHGKRLSARQTWLVEHLLPTITPTPTSTPTILEIGFGAGEHLRELAIQHPDAIIIGAEPFINGVASLLSAITNECGVRSVKCEIKSEYQNIRIWPDDVRKLLNNSTLHTPHPTLSQNPNLRFMQIWVLHPDPWPKARHEKRRLLSAEFLTLLSKHLAPGGQIIIGTDHHEYFDWIEGQVKKTNLRFTNYDLRFIQTRYMKKNMAGTAAPKYMVLTLVISQ